MRQLLQVLSLRKLVLEQDQDSRVEFFVRVEVRNVAGRQQDLVIQHEHVRELVGDIRNFAGKDLADFSIVDPILVLVLAVLHIGHRVLHQGVEERVAEIIQEVVDERGLDPYRIAFVFFDQQGFDLLLVGLTYVTVVRDNSDEQASFECEKLQGQEISARTKERWAKSGSSYRSTGRGGAIEKNARTGGVIWKKGRGGGEGKKQS